MQQQRKKRSGKAPLAEESGGTFDELLTQRTPASAPPVASWATPRPEESSPRRRARGATNLKAVPVVDEAADRARLYDRETVDALYDSLDLILPNLHRNDQGIYMHLFRRTVAAGKSKCIVSLADLGELARVSVSGATYSVRRLEDRSPQLIERTGRTLGKGKTQGVEIEVFWPVK